MKIQIMEKLKLLYIICVFCSVIKKNLIREIVQNIILCNISTGLRVHVFHYENYRFSVILIDWFMKYTLETKHYKNILQTKIKQNTDLLTEIIFFLPFEDNALFHSDSDPLITYWLRFSFFSFSSSFCCFIFNS